MTSSVAIILRTRDRPLLLARALASILSQRFQDWTLCLVNDGGSKDRLEAAVAPFLGPFGHRLRVIHNDVSRGMEAASNRGIEESTSTYVVVHDDDDSWRPDFLSETVAFLDRDENARFCGVVTWTELVCERIEGKEIHPISRRPYNTWYYHIDMHRLLGGNIFPPICFLFRRDIIDRIGAFNDDLPVLGDWDFNVRCLLAADIAVLPKILAHYHQRADPAFRDTYSNSVHADLSMHKRVNVAMRNRLLRRRLAENPSDLGPLAAVSQDFVAAAQRLDEVEAYLEHRISAKVIERLNQVEAYLAHRSSVEVIERLNQVEAYLAHHIAQSHEQLGALQADFGAVVDAAHGVRTMLRPARYFWRLLLPLRRLMTRLSERKM